MADDRDDRVVVAGCSNLRELFKDGAVGLDLDALQRGDFRSARARARRSSDVKPSAPAKRREGDLQLLTHAHPSLTCASLARWLAASTASMRRPSLASMQMHVHHLIVYDIPADNKAKAFPCPPLCQLTIS